VADRGRPKIDDPDAKRRLIEWLCTAKRDRDPQTQEQLARRLRISTATITNWKKDIEFNKAWEAHYLATVGSPERKQALMDTLFRTGSDADDPRHVAAARTYLDIAEGLRPQQIEVTVKRPAAELSEDELDAILARHAARERDLRLVNDEAS
jgi:transcriptional regulator with XRE-family HTH domain